MTHLNQNSRIRPVFTNYDAQVLGKALLGKIFKNTDVLLNMKIMFAELRNDNAQKNQQSLRSFTISITSTSA